MLLSSMADQQVNRNHSPSGNHQDKHHKLVRLGSTLMHPHHQHMAEAIVMFLALVVTRHMILEMVRTNLWASVPVSNHSNKILRTQ